MSLSKLEKEILELHTEYESMVKFFKFAVESTKLIADKKQLEFQLKMCKSMRVVLEMLLKIAERESRK